MYFLAVQAYAGLSPVKARPLRACRKPFRRLSPLIVIFKACPWRAYHKRGCRIGSLFIRHLKCSNLKLLDGSRKKFKTKIKLNNPLFAKKSGFSYT